MPKRKTDIPLALDYVAKVMRRRATVFVVSDFLETGFKKPLSLLNKRHDVIAVPVRDRVEVAMPSVGLIEVQDAETGQIMLVDTSSRKFRSQYGEHSSQPVQRTQEHASVQQCGLHSHRDGQTLYERPDSVLSHAASASLMVIGSKQATGRVGCALPIP